MRRSKSLGLGVLSIFFSACLIGACSASGSGSGADGEGNGTGTGDAAAAVDGAHTYGDAASSQTDSGPAKDSGKPTGIDSGSGGGTDSGGGGGGTAGACDTGSQTASFLALAAFIAANSPPECDASGMCSSGECCLDLLSVASGGTPPPGFPSSSYCVTAIDLSGLGL